MENLFSVEIIVCETAPHLGFASLNLAAVRDSHAPLWH
jgi:hypothetical protein